jgi:hypothetical protein
MKLRYSERANIAFRHRGNFGIASYGRYGYWEHIFTDRILLAESTVIFYIK